MSNRPIRLQKRLLQFNGIPFAFGEITDMSYTVAFKGQSQPYTNNAHGSYLPTFGESQKLQASTLRASFAIDFKKIACEDKIRYARFIKRELAKPGKLWAVQAGVELIWTNARVVDIPEEVEDASAKDLFKFSLTFELIDGYWRMAKRTRTFLCEYCPNRFEDFDDEFCVDLYDYNGVCTNALSCLPCNLGDTHTPEFEGCDWKPLCHYPLYSSRKDNGEALPSLYDMFGVNCANSQYIRYDCDLEAQRFCYDDSWGRKWRLSSLKDSNLTKQTFCARTDLPTNMVRVRLVGEFTDPTITINDDTVKIPGKYNGLISIGFGTEVWLSSNRRDPWDKDEKGNPQAMDLSYLAERTNTPMFELHAGQNTFTVTGNSYNTDSYVYIEEVAITW